MSSKENDSYMENKNEYNEEWGELGYDLGQEYNQKNNRTLYKQRLAEQKKVYDRAEYLNDLFTEAGYNQEL